MKSKTIRVHIKESTPTILAIKEDLPALSKATDHVNGLIAKELTELSQAIAIDAQELRAWIDLQNTNQKIPPAKSILHLLRTAKQYQLDPLQEEVLLTQYQDSWQISISVDGWIKLIHRHPTFAGVSFAQSPDNEEGLPLWMECTIYRSDQAIATTVREYLSEVINDSEIWKKMPRRMLRHRVLQQCARLAMGIAVKSVDEKDLVNLRGEMTAPDKVIAHANRGEKLASQSDCLKDMLKNETVNASSTKK